MHSRRVPAPAAEPGGRRRAAPAAVMQLAGHEDQRQGPPPERDHLIPEALKQVGWALAAALAAAPRSAEGSEQARGASFCPLC